MMEKDIASKVYLSNNKVFADLFNFFIYDGTPVIDPNNLTPLSIEQIAVLPGKGVSKNSTVRRYRDLLKTAVVMTDDNAAYLILGLESQSQIDYTMPVRNMVYDALEYDRQIKELTSEHKKIRDQGDFLKPVITLVLYLGTDRWSAPKSLYELFPPLDDRIKTFVNNYNVFIIEPTTLSEEEFDKFRTDFGKILNFIKNSNDDAAMEQLLASGKLKGLSREGGLFLKEVTHTTYDLEDKKEVDEAMCKAWDDAKIKARAEGLAEGQAVGLERGRIDAYMHAIKQIQENLKMTAEQAMDVLGIPKSEQNVYLNM